MALYPGTFHLLRFFSAFLLYARHDITDGKELGNWFGDLLNAKVLPGDVHSTKTACAVLGWRKVYLHLKRGQCHELAYAIVCRRLRVRPAQLDYLLRQARAGWPGLESIYEERFWCARIIKDVRSAESRIAKRDHIQDFERYKAEWPNDQLQRTLRIYLTQTSPAIFYRLLQSSYRHINAGALRRFLGRYRRGDLGPADVVGAEAFLEFAAETGAGNKPEELSDDNLLHLMSRWLELLSVSIRQIVASQTEKLQIWQ